MYSPFYDVMKQCLLKRRYYILIKVKAGLRKVNGGAGKTERNRLKNEIMISFIERKWIVQKKQESFQ
jgi:hypothetical protein